MISKNITTCTLINNFAVCSYQVSLHYYDENKKRIDIIHICNNEKVLNKSNDCGYDSLANVKIYEQSGLM